MSKSLTGQSVKSIGLNIGSSYLINDFSLIDKSFNDHIGLGLEGFLTLGFNKAEKVSLKLGLGFLYNQETGSLLPEYGRNNNGELLEAEIKNNFLTFDFLFIWTPVELINSNLSFEIGASSVAFVSGDIQISTDDLFFNRTVVSDDFIPGIKAALSYEKAIAKSFVLLKTSIGYVQFFDTNMINSTINLSVGLVWRLYKPKGRGLY